MSFTLPPPGITGLLVVLIVIAAVYDIRYRRIPNWLTLSGVLAGMAMNAFLTPVWPGLKTSLLGFAVGFGIYFALFAIRAMGAGDVKLMAAVGAMVGWQDWFAIFAITALLGGIFAVLFSMARGRLGKTFWNVGFILSEMKHGRPAYLGNEELDVTKSKGLRMPHGAIIALGTVLFLALGARYTS
jgi:prepilin peptidase CpaA